MSNIKDSTKDRFSMIHPYGDGLTTLTVRLVPHSLIPNEVREVMVEAMIDRGTCWHNKPHMGCFFQHEVGGNKREGMLEVCKVYEDWLESVGVEKGETILQEWDW